MPGTEEFSAEAQAANDLRKRSVADDPFDLAQELAERRRGSAGPPEAEPEMGFMEKLKGLLGFAAQEPEAPAAPPPSTAFSVAQEKMRLNLPLTPEEQAAVAAAGGR